MVPNDDSRIAPPGRYGELLIDLCESDPRLRGRSKIITSQRLIPVSRSMRVILLEFEEGSDAVQMQHIFMSPERLLDHFNQEQNNGTRRLTNAVYLVEGVNQSVIDILGQQFDMHPSIFMEYENVAQGAAHDYSPAALLASALATRSYLCMNYEELVRLPDEACGKNSLRCTRTGRKIRVTRLNGEFDNVGMLRRKCIHWARIRPENGGWDSKRISSELRDVPLVEDTLLTASVPAGIILCDPPLRSVRIKQEISINGSEVLVGPDPLEGGYVDFLPEHIQVQCRHGPPRSSLAEDMRFYLTTHGNLIGITSPDAVSLFLKKIVASHYTRHFGYLAKNIEKAQKAMRRQPDFATFSLSAVEANWSDAQTLSRRLGQYSLELEGILVQLRASLDPPDPSQILSWHDVEADFRLLYHRYSGILQHAEAVNSSITALAGITGNRQAFKEQQLALRAAERSRNLTFIGLVFIPLAFVSSLFGMSEPYGPGGDKFWLYFAISIPVAVFVVAAYRTVDIIESGYGPRLLLSPSVSGIFQGLVRSQPSQPQSF